MRVLVTGVTGFIGYHLAERLRNDGYHVGGLLRRDRNRETSRVEELDIDLYYGDLTDPWAIRSVLTSFRPEVICHLGAKTRVAESFSRPFEYMQVNLMGTITIAEAAKELCPELRKFVFAGSVEEYGNQPKQLYPLKEDVELHPNAPYAVAKVAAEKYLRFLHRAYGFPAILFRQTNCYGRTRDNFFIVEWIVTQMLNSSVARLGSPKPVRDFMYLQDLLDAYARVMKQKGRDLYGEVYNISTGRGVSIKELATMTARLINWRGKIHWNTRPRRPGEVWRIECDHSKFSKATGWKPQTKLEEGLRKTIEHWRKVDRL